MKEMTYKLNLATRPSFSASRLVTVVSLVLALVLVRSIFSHTPETPDRKEGAERLTTELPAVTELDSNPRRIFANGRRNHQP